MIGSASLVFTTLARLADVDAPDPEKTLLDSATSLEKFLAGVERRAFRIAQMAVRDRDDALDIGAGRDAATRAQLRPAPERRVEAVVLPDPVQRHPRFPAAPDGSVADLRMVQERFLVDLLQQDPTAVFASGR